ncbi:MAG: hypothetical protein C4287_20320, partial [Leptolyngbya sp. ERB_1_2]
MDIQAIRSGKVKQLAGVDLQDEDLSKADLNGVNFAGAKLSGADFTEAKSDTPSKAGG